MRKLAGFVTVAVVMFAAPVFACDKDKAAHAKASGCQGKEVHAQTAAAKGGCHGRADSLAAKVMEKLPAMTYRVGDFTTPCPQTANEKAGADGKVQYVVDGKAYDCKGDATKALAALLEKEAGEMMTVRYAVGDETYGCPMSAKDAAAQKNTQVSYRLAGLSFNSQDEANRVAKVVSEAVAKLAQSEGAPAKAGCGASAEAMKASATGGCSKAKAETASATGGCSKAKAETASATGGCSKAKAETASADGRSEGAPAASGCCKSKAAAATASAKGGCDKAKAETASATGGCSKAKAETASATGGCDKSKAQTASALGCCSKEKAALTGTPTCCEEAEKLVASARAKLQVIIETVLASSAS